MVDDHDRAYFGRGNDDADHVGYLDEETKAIFGWSSAAEPDVLVTAHLLLLRRCHVG